MAHRGKGENANGSLAQARRAAEEARRHRQTLQEFGDYIRTLADWRWVLTISFRHAVAPERAFARAEDFLVEVEKAAGGRIAWAIALSRGDVGGRVHPHVLIAYE